MELSKFKTVEQLAAAIKSLDMVTTVPWTDYSGTSWVTGWSSFTNKVIDYKRIAGGLVFVKFRLAGTSDATNANFTLPSSITPESDYNFTCWGRDNTGTRDATIAFLDDAGPDVDIYWGGSATGWTASGTKECNGEFWYEAA